MPTWPEKGARMVFRSMRACRLSTCALARCASATARSRSDCGTLPLSRRRFARSSSTSAKRASASAALNSARSTSTSSCTSRSPSATFWPFSKLIDCTTPPTSVSKRMPWMGSIEPTACQFFVQTCSTTSKVETVSGGGPMPSAEAPIALNCNTFVPKTVTRTTIKAMIKMRLKETFFISNQ